MDNLDSYKKILNKKGEVYLRLKAHPCSAKTRIKEILSGEDGETIKIDIAAIPKNGKANQELIRFLSKEFNVVKNNIIILNGAGDKIKLIKIKF